MRTIRAGSEVPFGGGNGFVTTSCALKSNRAQIISFVRAGITSVRLGKLFEFFRATGIIPTTHGGHGFGKCA